MVNFLRQCSLLWMTVAVSQSVDAYQHTTWRTLPKVSNIRFFIRGDRSQFLRNAHLIIAHHMQCIVFADSLGCVDEYYSLWLMSSINPQCKRRRVTVVILSVCLSVTTKSAVYLVYMSKTRCHRVLYGNFKVFVVWLSLQMLHSKVMASFAIPLLPDELLMDRRDSDDFFSTWRVCTVSDNTYNTAESSLITAH